MASGYILIVAVLVLGGVIAASGDRVGTRVGKARLTLFNLRPRQTATLVTIMTGMSIAASTLGILLAANEQLRTGVFDLKRIQNKLSSTRKELTKVAEQKNQVETELAKARSDQADAQKLLDATNESLKAVIVKQSQTAKELNSTQLQLKRVSEQKEALGREIQQLQTERQELIQQRNQVKEQVNQLNAQVGQLNAQVNQLNAQVNQLKAQISQRDQQINRRDQIITQRDRVIAQREEFEKQLKQGIAERENRLTSLKTLLQEQESQLQQRQAQLQARDQQLQERQAQLQARDQQLREQDQQLQKQETKLRDLEKQQSFLAQEVANLEQYYGYYQTLRQGNVALLRNQVLAAGVLRIVDPTAARQAVDQLLSQAHRSAIEATGVNTSKSGERVVQITPAQVEQLIKQIQDGRDYVVRILSAGNYVVGEKQVQVFADAVPNQVVFADGEVVATTAADPSTMSNAEIRKRIDSLVAASQFRARRSGMLNDTIQIGDGRITTLIRFLEEVNQYSQPLDFQAVVSEDTYTAGPMKIKLQALQGGRVLFST